MTLGYLIHFLKNKLELNNDVDEILINALKARNHIIHRVLIDNVELFMQEKTRNNLIKEIRKLRQQVQKGISILDPLILEWSKSLDRLELKKYEEWIKSNFN